MEEIQVQAGIDPQAIYREVSRIASLPALAELIDNAFDAGSLHCNIFTDDPRRPTTVYVVDSGTGMNNDGLTAFFNYGRSEWLTKRHKGRNGKGSKYMLFHAKSVTVCTKVAGEKQCRKFSITLKSWMDKILSRQKVPVQFVTRGDQQYEPTSESFTVFSFVPHDTKRVFFAEETLIENLAQHLSPQFANRVFINGKAIKPLENLSGITFETTDPTLGEVRAYIYRPEKIRHREGMRIDDLRIGTTGPVMEFQAFIRGLAPDLRKQIPTCFHSVCGLIEVEGFNEWREGASREFRDELYLSPAAKVFVSFLENVLGPQIVKEFGFAEATIAERERQTFRSLRAVAENVWGPALSTQETKRPKPYVPSTFSISPFSIEMIPGEKQLFTVSRGDQDATYEWDASSIPGAHLNHNIGTTVELMIDANVSYTPDQYQLVVRLMPAGVVVRRAYIKLVPFRELTIVPRSGSYYVDDRITFKAVNIPTRCKTLQWSIEPASAGEFVKSIGLDNINFVCKEPGKLTISAVNPQNPLIKAQTEIYVHTKETVTVPTPPTEDVIPIEDTVFVLRTLNHGSNTQAIREEVAPNRIVLHINVQHPRYVQTLQGTESAFREYLTHLLVANHVALVAEKRDISHVEQEELTGQLLAKFI